MTSSSSSSSSGDAVQREIAKEVYQYSFEVIQRYVDIIVSRGVEWGLLGPREPDRIWARHILNSAAVSGVVPRGCRVMDVGSGAGLPGLPLSILRPDLTITLVESLERRSHFLQLAVDELGLADRVSVVRSRAEEVRLDVDVVTCRAVAPLPKLLRWTHQHFLPDGQLIALKGERAEAEVSEASKDVKRLGCVGSVVTVRAHQRAEPTQAVVVRRG